MASLTKTDHLYLLDGSGYIFRAYHALPPLTRRSDGLPIGAVTGFCNMLAKLLDDADATHMAIIFDASGTTFRNEIYPAYKANRGETPEDLVPQFPLVREATRAFHLPAIEVVGFEADDIIATYTKQAASTGARVTIVSSDKDLMQLVGGSVTMLDTMKARAIGEAEVQEKFGVLPNRVVDVQALAGDSSDNVPGVPGIGIKTAADLINQFGDLDTLLARAEEITQNKRRENLINFAEQARLSRELVQLRDDVPCPMPLHDMGVRPPDGATLIGFLKAMGFNKITTRMAARYGFDEQAYEASSEAAEAAETPKDQSKDQTKDQTKNKPSADSADANAANATSHEAALLRVPFDHTHYETITTQERLRAFIALAHESGVMAIDTETDGLDTMRCRLVGISLAVAAGTACYIPLQHGQHGQDSQHEESGMLALDAPLDVGLDAPRDTLETDSAAQLPLAVVVDLLAPILKDSAVLKVLQNAKFDLKLLTRYGLVVAPIDDTMLISYTLYGGLHGAGMDELSTRYLQHKPIAIKELIGSGKKQITFDQVPIDTATRYAAEDADITWRLWQLLKPRLAGAALMGVYESTERALVPILCAMERVGMLVDKAELGRLSVDFAKSAAAHEARIYELAGEHFNIASPKQLGVILFDKQGLTKAKKTKGGTYSTDSEVLENLAHGNDETGEKGSELASEVLAWRGLTKLKSTYSDALAHSINAETGRIHTSYAAAATSTGRLSSSEPNLQNIPIRTSAGRRIRRSFIAAPDCALVSADYSQIELRVLAHMADIGALKQAFAEGQDIHALTASEIFNVPMAEMTPEVRRRAKAINFGIIYGISAFGLARQLNIGRGEASDIIKAYFAKFPGIKDYMEQTKEKARAAGYVETLFGRRIHTREIAAKMPARRAFAERAAINAPIQGTAADIIRRAMIAMPPALDAADLKEAQMLMQVHDELVFEVATQKSAALMAVVKKTMAEACAPRLVLSVPLVVDVKAGENWDEAH